MVLLTYKFKSQVSREVEARKSPAQAETIIKTSKYKARLYATYFLVQTLFDKVSVGAAWHPVRGGCASAPEHGPSGGASRPVKPVIGLWKGALERVITVDWMRDAYTGGGWIVSP